MITQITKSKWTSFFKACGSWQRWFQRKNRNLCTTDSSSWSQPIVGGGGTRKKWEENQMCTENNQYFCGQLCNRTDRTVPDWAMGRGTMERKDTEERWWPRLTPEHPVPSQPITHSQNSHPTNLHCMRDHFWNIADFGLDLVTLIAALSGSFCVYGPLRRKIQ